MPTGATGPERLKKLTSDIAKNLIIYETEVKKFERARIEGEFQDLDRDHELHPEDPYQSELYELLVGPCKQLIDAAQKAAQDLGDEDAPID